MSRFGGRSLFEGGLVRISRTVEPRDSSSTAALTSRHALAAVLVLGVSYAFNGMDRQVFPALLAPISEEYGLSLSYGGLLSNIFTLNIAIFGALSGFFVARLGRKRVLLIGLIFYSIFTLLTGFAQNYAQLIAFRALTGIGEALHIAVIFAIVGA